MIWHDRPVRSLRVLAVTAYAVLAAITVAIVDPNPGDALAGSSAAALAALLAAGALLVVAAVAAPGGRFAVLLAAAALAWPVAEWSNPGAGAAFTVGLALSAAWPALLAAAALYGPGEAPLGRAGGAVVGVALVANLGLLGLVSAALFDPRAEGCGLCPANGLLLVGDAEAADAAARAGLALAVVWTFALGVVSVVRLARGPTARRRVAWPVLVPAAAAIALFGFAALHGLDRGFLSNDPTDRALRGGQAVALALVAAGIAWGRLRASRARAALARLVVDLGASPAPGSNIPQPRRPRTALRERLAQALGDPSLELVHRLDGAGWIDAAGRPAILPAGATRIVAGGRELSALVHRPGLLDDPALRAEIAAAVRLGLEHDRLHAARRARLVELRASRARIVATADAERRRLEHDLHDGAQQRLVALALGVRLARRRLADSDPALNVTLAEAEERLRGVAAGVRDLAHGVFPAVLAEEGLGVALEALAEHEPRLVVGVLPESRCAAAAESAAYFVVVETLRRTPDGDIAVDTRIVGERLDLDIRTEAEPGGAPTRLEDRVGAVGGTLATSDRHLRAELPCAS
jgi:signal transduction histidine kinase